MHGNKYFTVKHHKNSYPIRYYFAYDGKSYATFCKQYKRLRAAGFSRKDARYTLLMAAVLFAEEKLD